MFEKKIFKKKSKSKKKFFYFFLILIFLYGIYIFFFKKIDYFIIDPNKNIFYTVPDDKEGIEIPNTNKKGLHLSYDYSEDIFIDKNPDINFSIQIETNEDYFFIKKRKIKLLDNASKFFNNSNLFLAKNSTNLGNEYFLLFGNFDKKSNALIFCKKFISIDGKCIVVNVQKLD